MMILIDNGHGVNTPGKCSPRRSVPRVPLHSRDSRRGGKATQGRRLRRKTLHVLMSPDTISEEGEPSKIIAEYQAYNVYVQGRKLKAKGPELYNKDETQL